MDAIRREHDVLFREKSIWLFGGEHLAKHEFQRGHLLADIMGFYRAFGVVPQQERPDALSSELEFMHFLIFKQMHAKELGNQEEEESKSQVCLEAQVKFCLEHLYPAVMEITEKILAEASSEFYKMVSTELREFMELEVQHFQQLNLGFKPSIDSKPNDPEQLQRWEV